MPTTASSAAARVAIAARDAGFDLAAVTFVVKSEPLTAARRQLIEDTSAQVIVLYGSMEVPTVSTGCATSTLPDDMHLAADLIALITRPRMLGKAVLAVDALTLMSTLSPNAGKIPAERRNRRLRPESKSATAAACSGDSDFGPTSRRFAASTS